MKSPDAVLIQQAFPSHRAMLQLTEPIHRAYCERHNIEYACVYLDELPKLDRGENWSKLGLIRHYLEMDMQYDYVFWLDNDALIVGDSDLRDAVPDGIGMARHELDWGMVGEKGAYDHFNSGVIVLRNTPAVRDFTEKWWNTPDEGHMWGDQHSLHLCGQANPGVVSKIDHRWNSTPPYFSVTEGEVVRAWHGLFNAQDRYAIVRSAVDSLLSGGSGHEAPIYRAKIRAEEFRHELSYGMRKIQAV